MWDMLRNKEEAQPAFRGGFHPYAPYTHTPAPTPSFYLKGCVGVIEVPVWLA